MHVRPHTRGVCLLASHRRRACLPAPMREGLICRILRGTLACQHLKRQGLACQHPIREGLVTSTSYARCLQTHRTRSAGKRPAREVLASSPYTRCLKRPIRRAYEAPPHIPGTNTKDAAGGTLLLEQTAKETAGALLVGQAAPPPVGGGGERGGGAPAPP